MNEAIQKQQDMNNYHNSLIQLTKGGRINSRGRRRKGGAVLVPQFSLKYEPTGPNPNDIIKNITQISNQAKANSVYDNEVYGVGYPLPKGGKTRKTRKTRKTKTNKRRHKKGGNANWKWGCYSGGGLLFSS
jgi:hypothetical protein